MPIYAYKCTSCGHERDVLQKLSDPVLKSCPACGADAFAKQITAAGFQLKGSGWYATDFRNNGGAPPAAKSTDKPGDKPASDTDAASAAAPKADVPSAAPAAAPAADAGGRNDA
jgi:putative FmdB family regulatory protein